MSIWFPVMCFVGLGSDHVIANMYFIPLAIFLGAEKPLTVGYYIWKSMIPSLIGNFVGGGLFTGVIYCKSFHPQSLPSLSMIRGRPLIQL